MSEPQKKNPAKCTSPEFRVSYPHVFKAHSGFEGQEEKYSVSMLFDKKTDLTALKRAVLHVATEEWGPKDKGKWPKKLRLPFRDGDDEKPGNEEYAGKIFVNATSKNRPGVVDGKVQPMTEEDGTFYAGCYARATLVAFAYNKMGNVGVAFGLNNLQKLRDGEPLGGKSSATSDFDAVEDLGESDAAEESDDMSDLGI